MGKYKMHHFNVYVEEGSDLERRIQALADQDDETFEETLCSLVNLSLKYHLERNVELLERSKAKK